MKYSIAIYIYIFGLLTSCNQPKIRKPIVHKSNVSFFEESIKINQQLIKQQEALFKNIIEQDTINTYKNSTLGFWYYFNVKNKKQKTKVKSGSELIINYEIRDINNNIILKADELGSKNQKNKSDRLLKIDGEDFILGLHEGIKLMQEGETATFLLPSIKAFGVTGLQGKIAPNEPLIIKVNVKQILNK